MSGNVPSTSELLIWLLWVPLFITCASIALCIVYRYQFNRPLLGGDSAPISHSAAWNRAPVASRSGKIVFSVFFFLCCVVHTHTHTPTTDKIIFLNYF